MHYLQDLGAHEIHGPFNAIAAAHRYAAHRHLGAYALLSEAAARRSHDAGSFRLVPLAWRN